MGLIYFINLPRAIITDSTSRIEQSVDLEPLGGLKNPCLGAENVVPVVVIPVDLPWPRKGAPKKIFP